MEGRSNTIPALEGRSSPDQVSPLMLGLYKENVSQRYWDGQIGMWLKGVYFRPVLYV